MQIWLVASTIGFAQPNIRECQSTGWIRRSFCLTILMGYFSSIKALIQMPRLESLLFKIKLVIAEGREVQMKLVEQVGHLLPVEVPAQT